MKLQVLMAKKEGIAREKELTLIGTQKAAFTLPPAEAWLLELLKS